MPQFSQRSLNRLETCHPDLQCLMKNVIKVYDVTILKGYRGEQKINKAAADYRDLAENPDDIPTACYRDGIALSEYCAFRDINPVPVVTDTQFAWLKRDKNKLIKDFLKIEAQAEMDYCAKEVD